MVALPEMVGQGREGGVFRNCYSVLLRFRSAGGRGQCLGQYCPRSKARKAHVYTALAFLAYRPFNEREAVRDRKEKYALREAYSRETTGV